MYLYCRLCADPRTTEELLNLSTDEKKFEDVLTKLNAMYVDVATHDKLPKTVCFPCYEMLNKAYEFLDRVKKAQDILSTLFSANDSMKIGLSDEDGGTLDDFFNETCNDLDVKEESLAPTKEDDFFNETCKDLDVKEVLLAPTKEPGPQSSAEIIKIEPKEEICDQNCIYPDEQPENKMTVQDLLKLKVVKVRKVRPVFEVTERTVTWKKFPWFCKLCSIEFTDLEILRTHNKTVHSKCALFHCVDCRAFKKTDCLESFVKHVRIHRKDLRNRCHYCDEPVDRSNLSTHVSQHYSVTSRPCKHCGELLPSKEAYESHIKQFQMKQTRKPRRKAGDPITEEDLTCHMCKKVYKNKNSLRDHIKRHNVKSKNYTCERCGKAFYTKGSLTCHIMAHDKVRPHICRICNKSFLFPNMLRRHVEMHSGVKPYSCEICGRCFRLQYQLNAHKIVHTDSMPYVCSYCNKAFRFKQILKSHERQHTGAKPYSCEHCFMEFSNWSNFNKHMKRRHNIDTSKKKITPTGVFPVNPETGQIIQVDSHGMEEWKSKVMIPAKRGKKKMIKQENIEDMNMTVS